ncbi:MAG: rhomboid family intramembrane serine protease [Vicinamibacterales bacterium]
MLKRQTTGSVICTSCGVLVGVNDDRCYNCGRRNPGLWGYAPALRNLGRDLGFVPFVIGTCFFLYVLALIMSQGNIGMRGMMSFLAPDQVALLRFGASGAHPVFNLGFWWTVLTAGWLHGSALHILFNMLWVRDLAPVTANLYGPGRTIIIYVAAGAAGFIVTSAVGAFLPPIPILGGAQVTIGASASLFGLFGALVSYGRRTGSRAIGDTGLQYALMLGIFGFILPGIDNWAHGGGFAGGYVAARLLDPLKPERIDHLLLAVVLLAVSLMTVAAHFIYTLRYAG